MSGRRLSSRPLIWVALVGFGLWHATAPAGLLAETLPPITTIAFTPDGREVVAGSQAGLEVRSWPALARIATIPTELLNIHDLAFSPDGTFLAVAGGQPGAEGTVEFFTWPKRELVRRVSPHNDVVYAITWQSDGKELALASGDGRVGLLNFPIESAARYFEGHSRAVLATAFLNKDNGLLSAGVDTSLRLWDMPSRSVLRILSNHTGDIHDLKVRPTSAPDSEPIVASAGDDRTVRFWQPTIGRLIRFARLESAPLALAWADDGSVVWAACKDGHLRGIDPTDASVRSDLRAIDGIAYTVAVAPDGSVLVAGSEGQLQITDPPPNEQREPESIK
jgi:WD40 repeat protein